MGLLFFFIDGVGIGPSSSHNPLSRIDAPILGIHADRVRNRDVTGLPAGWIGTTLDAALGVPGLPQSASGQAALLTGRNAPALLGAHQSALPGKRLRDLVSEYSLLKRARDGGRRVTFANAFRSTMFEILSADGRPKRGSVSTLAMFASGAPFRDLDDLQAGRAVAHDLTRDALRERGYDVPPAAPDEAASHLAALARAHDLTLFEFFLTDLVGHGRIDRPAGPLVEMLDRVLGRLTAALDPICDGLLVTSDHGNIEDLSTSAHTMNPVPLLLWGRTRDGGRGLPVDLMGVTPLLLAALALDGEDQPARGLGEKSAWTVNASPKPTNQA